MRFSYRARTKDGQLQVGFVEGESRDAAASILLGHGLFVLGLEQAEGAGFFDRVFSWFRRVKLSDMMVFTRQFATLLEAQVSLSEALNALYRQTASPILKDAIAEVADDVEAGSSLSHALERQGGVFSEFYVNMVRSAEVTGRLSEVLNYLADYLEREADLASRVKNAVFYPLFVIVLFLLVMTIMITVVLPQIAPIFEETNVDLPAFTAVVLALGIFLREWWWAALIVFGLGTLMVLDYFKSPEGRAVWDEMMFRIPILGLLFRKLYIARFAESTKVLIAGGLTIPQAIEVSSHTIGNTVYRERLREAADQVRKGRLLSEVLSRMGEFPPLVSQLVAVGESTGKLQELLEKVNLFYTREVSHTVENLVTMIQPILMVIIGVMVALLFGSVLMPIYKLSQSFGI